MKKMTKNPYPTKSPKLIIHARLFYFLPKEKTPNFTSPAIPLPFPNLLLLLPGRHCLLHHPPRAACSQRASSPPCIPLLQRSRPASAPAAPTAAAAGAAVRTASASSPSPSFLAPFLLLLPLPLPRLPGASRIHTYPKNQTNKETKSPESSSSTTISSHFIIWMCAQMHVIR